MAELLSRVLLVEAAEGDVMSSPSALLLRLILHLLRKLDFMALDSKLFTLR